MNEFFAMLHLYRISNDIIVIPMMMQIIRAHFFRILRYGCCIFALKNKYVGSNIAITTKIPPANDKVFMNAFGIIAEIIYAGNIVAIAAMNFEPFNLFCNERL